MNSEPKVYVSQLPYFFDNQYTGAEFRYTRNPVLDLRVIQSPAWSASTYALITNPIPLDSGMS